MRPSAILVVVSLFLAACAGGGGTTARPNPVPSGTATPLPTIATNTYPLTSGFQPASFFGHGSIVAGPDGNLWMTECLTIPNVGFGRIAKITAAGVLTEYVLTGGVARCPGQISAGPDGAMWFTEYPGNNTSPPPAIGRIDMSGTITEYPLPASDAFGGSIVLGADGNLWYDARNISGGSAIRGFSPTTHAIIDSVPIPPPMMSGTLVSNPVDGSIIVGTSENGSGISNILQVVPGTTGSYVVKYSPSSANSGDWSNVALGADGNIYVQFVPSASGTAAGLARMNESTYNVTLFTETQFTQANGHQSRTAFRGPIIYGPDATIYVWDEGQQDDFIGVAALTTTGTLLAQQDDGSNFHDVASGIAIGSDGKIWVAVSNELASHGSVYQLAPVR